MATERDFITPAGVTVSTTANVVGNTVSSDHFVNTLNANNYPVLTINFAKSGYLDPRVIFSRASSATYVDADGYIKVAGNNVPRFQYSNGVCQGLLIEETRTNYLIVQTGYGASFFKQGTVTGPDGAPMTAFIPPAGWITNYDSPHAAGSFHTPSTAVGANTDYVYTVYLGPTIGNTSDLTFDLVIVADLNGASPVYGEWVINTSTWTTVYRYASSPWSEISSSLIQDSQTGIYKATWIVRLTGDATGRNRVGAGSQIRSQSNPFWVADGVGGVQFACAQFEAGAWPTSYIPTTTTSATRAADNVSMSCGTFEFNPRQGTLFVEAISYKPYSSSTSSANDRASLATFLSDWSLRSSVPYNELTVRREDSDYSISAVFYDPQLGFTSSGSPANIGLPNTVIKAAVSYFSNGYMYIAANGNIATSGQNTYTPPLGNQTDPTKTILNIGNYYAPSQRPLNGVMRKLIYWQYPLSNTEITNITL